MFIKNLLLSCVYTIFVFSLGEIYQLEKDKKEYQRREKEFVKEAEDFIKSCDEEIVNVNKIFYQQEIECIDELKEVELMLYDLYMYMKVKDGVLLKELSKYNCFIKEEL